MFSVKDNTLKLSLPLRASEVIYDSEVHFVSEVSPNGEVVGKLTSLVQQHELHCKATSLLRKQKLHKQKKEQAHKIFSSCVVALFVVIRVLADART